MVDVPVEHEQEADPLDVNDQHAQPEASPVEQAGSAESFGANAPDAQPHTSASLPDWVTGLVQQVSVASASGLREQLDSISNGDRLRLAKAFSRLADGLDAANGLDARGPIK